MASHKVWRPQHSNNSIGFPVGFQVRIVQVVNEYHKRDSTIVDGPGKDIFYALFDEDDTDFEIKVVNRSEWNVEFTLTIGNEDRRYVIRRGGEASMKAVESGGKHLHFLSQKTAEGKLLVAMNARLNGTTYEEAAVNCSRIEFRFALEKSVAEYVTRRPAVNKHIYVTELDGLTFHLKFNPKDTIEGIKRKIQDKVGLLPDTHLSFEGKELEDVMNASDYGIQNGSVLHVVKGSGYMPVPSKAGPTMMIYFMVERGGLRNDLQAKTARQEDEYYIFHLKVNPRDSIEEVKRKILHQEGIPLRRQCFVFSGKELEDETAVSDHGLKIGSVLHLNHRLSRGYRPVAKVDKKTDPAIFIYFKTPDLMFHLEVDPQDTIEAIKYKIQDQEGIPVYQQGLASARKRLEDAMAVSECGLTNGSVVHFFRALHSIMFWRNRKFVRQHVSNFDEDVGPMVIYVETMHGGMFHVEADPQDTIGIIKAKIQDQEGIPVEEQCLIFEGKQLEGDEISVSTLSHLGIRNGFILSLVQRLRGGYGRPVEMTGKLDDGEEVDFGERGVVCFGRKTNQRFHPYSKQFVYSGKYFLKGFTVELRTKPKCSAHPI